MSAPAELCPPRYSDGGTYYVCGRALSHELAMQLASRDPDRPQKIGPEETNKENVVNPVKGVNAEQERRIRKLVYEGMAEHKARDQVLGKGWVEL